MLRAWPRHASLGPRDCSPVCLFLENGFQLCLKIDEWSADGFCKGKFVSLLGRSLVRMEHGPFRPLCKEQHKRVGGECCSGKQRLRWDRRDLGLS